MSKRPYPWEDFYHRQIKMRVNDQRARVNNESHMNEVFGARRAAMQPPVPQGDMPGCSNLDLLNVSGHTDEMDMDDYETYEMRHSRLDKLRNMEKRDPSPIPSTQNLLTSFINTTRRTHGPFSDAEKDTLLQQAKTYKQLNIDSFVRNRDFRANTNENCTERDKNQKDMNHNKEMEF